MRNRCPKCGYPIADSAIDCDICQLDYTGVLQRIKARLEAERTEALEASKDTEKRGKHD